MEIGLGVTLSMVTEPLVWVLILVLVEIGLGELSLKVVMVLLALSLNPCFSGNMFGSELAKANNGILTIGS